MKKEKKNNIIMTVIIGVVCIVLFAVMFMQFKTIEETDITAIENMRETELRTEISKWKTQYEETAQLLEENKKSIQEYQDTIEKNEEASDLIDQDLVNANMRLGKTDVYGEGIIITLNTDNYYMEDYYALLELVNELRYAGAEAISINDARVLSSTSITQPLDDLIIVGEQRVSSPYVVKAIGNQTYLSSTLSLKDSGYIDRYTASGMEIEIETGKNIEILKYSGNLEINYMKESEE